MWRKLFCLVAFAAIFYAPAPGSATLILGSAQDFAVLGGSTVTNTGPTTIYGNLGLYPGTSITGFPPGVVTGGTVHTTDAVAQQAQSDALSAYSTLQALPYAYNYTGFTLGSAGYTTLTPGVYHFDNTAQLTGALTLDFLSNPNGYFVFQIGSTLTTASSSVVNVINGNSLSGVYWQVGSSATLGSSTSFAGNILANQSITLNTSAAILSGRAIALNGAVTMDTNSISNNNTVQDFSSYGFSGGAPVPVPIPGTFLLTCSGMGIMFAFRRFFSVF